VLVRDKDVADYYEKLAQAFKALNLESQALDHLNKLAYNYLASDLVGLAALKNLPVDEHFVSIENFQKLIMALAADKINSASAKKILTIITDASNTAWTKNGLEGLLSQYVQNNNEETLLPLVQEVLAKNVKAVTEYKAGKVTVIQFLVGQTMAVTHGKASPDILKKLLEQELGK
jgi:aspartyl-tRNA(Asn)/glutamyl-tRNA(Gln) amidotransferase subunit B